MLTAAWFYMYSSYYCHCSDTTHEFTWERPPELSPRDDTRATYDASNDDEYLWQVGSIH
jgi:hypothetical protein